MTSTHGCGSSGFGAPAVSGLIGHGSRHLIADCVECRLHAKTVDAHGIVASMGTIACNRRHDRSRHDGRLFSMAAELAAHRLDDLPGEVFFVRAT